MKIILSLLFIVFLSFIIVVPVNAQSKIGDNPTTIEQGSLLELESLSKGLRLPRVPLNDINNWTLDGAAVSGMLIFNESGTAPKGLYYWSMDLSQWVRIVNSAELTGLITAGTRVSNASANNKLSTTVNGVTSLAVDIIRNNSLSIVDGVLTSTVNGVASSSGVNVLSSANNGLSPANGNVQLGGALTKPTAISTSATNTLALTKLQDGTLGIDSLLVVAANTGIVRKISSNVLSGGSNVLKSVEFAASDGQKRFATPAAITDIKKIQVYRNGINVEFTQVDATHIELEAKATCYANDEVKIIQLF
jgi:hypothetical protein